MTSQRNRIRHYLPIVGLVVATAGLEACLGDQRVDSNSGQERKIVLSIRAMKSYEFRSELEEYQVGEGTGTDTLCDKFIIR